MHRGSRVAPKTLMSSRASQRHRGLAPAFEGSIPQPGVGASLLRAALATLSVLAFVGLTHCGSADSSGLFSGSGPSSCEDNGECPASQPICSASGTCAGCTESVQCGNETCNLSTGRCVDCVSAEDCDGDEACNVRSGQCTRQCERDKDCKGSDKCDLDNGYCVECLSTADCRDQRVCSATTGACVECNSQSDCGGREPYCATSEGECRECRSTADCDEGERCDARGECEEFCSADDQCGGKKPRCDVGSGECVECRIDSDCDDETCDVTDGECR